MTSDTLWQGWWGLLSVFAAPVTMLMNIGARSRIRALPHPVGHLRPQLAPGRRVLARPPALVVMTVLVLALATRHRAAADPRHAAHVHRRRLCPQQRQSGPSRTWKRSDCSSPEAEFWISAGDRCWGHGLAAASGIQRRGEGLVRPPDVEVDALAGPDRGHAAQSGVDQERRIQHDLQNLEERHHQQRNGAEMFGVGIQRGQWTPSCGRDDCSRDGSGSDRVQQRQGQFGWRGRVRRLREGRQALGGGPRRPRRSARHSSTAASFTDGQSVGKYTASEYTLDGPLGDAYTADPGRLPAAGQPGR